MDTVIHFSEWMGGLGHEDGDDDGQYGSWKVGGKYYYESAVADEEVTYPDLSEGVHHLKIL